MRHEDDEMKKYNAIFTEKQQKYLHFDQLKLISMNILQVKKIPPDQSRIIEQAKLTYCPLGKAFEKQTKKLKIHLKNK